ncbi:50S ribosomal protein L31 [Streptomyces spiralis]
MPTGWSCASTTRSPASTSSSAKNADLRLPRSTTQAPVGKPHEARHPPLPLRSPCATAWQASSHPFRTGTAHVLDTTGRAERFAQRYDATTAPARR